jgi:uncharacterized protein YfaS (alpha-2-macroglobulin family)
MFQRQADRVVDERKIDFFCKNTSAGGVVSHRPTMERNDAPHNKRAISALQVDWLLAKQPFGLVLAEISDPADKHSAQRLLLQVTNLGISAKFSPHNNAIWVTRLDNTQPVVDAKVEIRDDQNRLLWQGTTDKSGLVETPGWKTLSLMAENEWSRPRQWIFVSHQGDFAYTASDWGTGIFPYRFGIDYEWNPQPDFCQGLMFTDRGLYRAGEAVFIKGIVRQKKVDSWVARQQNQSVCRFATVRAKLCRCPRSIFPGGARSMQKFN